MTRTADDRSLTADEVLRVAYASLILNVEQHNLAAIMGVNSGRINEACRAIEWAMANYRDAYKLARGKARVEPAEDDLPF